MKSGRLNVGPDHLFRIGTGKEPTNFDDGLLNVQLFRFDMANDYYDQLI